MSDLPKRLRDMVAAAVSLPERECVLFVTMRGSLKNNIISEAADRLGELETGLEIRTSERDGWFVRCEQLEDKLEKIAERDPLESISARIAKAALADLEKDDE